MYMKKISLLFLILILLVSLSGCPYPWVYVNHPCNKYDTTWSTADGKSAFYIPEDLPNTIGLIYTNEGLVPFYYYANTIDDVVYLDVKDNFDMAELEYHVESSENHFEAWRAISVKPGKYTVRVEESTYFTPGEILTFYCVDGNHLDDPEYLQAEIAKIQREEKKSQWIARGILTGAVALVVAIVVLLLRRKRRRRKLG